MKTITELVIDRKKWLTPDKQSRKIEPFSCLLNSEGNMCCLGFACKVLGFEDNQMLNKTMPNAIINELSQFTLQSILNEPYYINTDLASKAAEINDDFTINNYTRERQLIVHFANYNITLSFIN